MLRNARPSMVVAHHEKMKSYYIRQHGKKNNHSEWRIALTKEMESYKFEMFIVLLLLLDVWCVFIEILSYEGALNLHLDWVQGMVDGFTLASKTIVAMFVIDTVMHIVAFGPKHYFGNKWYVLDGVVVLITAVLEFVVHPLVHHESHAPSGPCSSRLLESTPDDSQRHTETTTSSMAVLFVIMRAWRFIRLLHGIAFSEKLRNDEIRKIEKEEGQLELELKEE
eukprot:CAMPEP_0118659454 /NCGR_PEP_ID=MMETSP0785-20121206/15119_1 /TAXON_ID=91992 /ORGANISM="Bolidomonas pacifica, Strain CCMP 1866" /LENGTH=222 /DNA_ID=CAMNT_0006552557 /DNA_START=1 /DNA_END=666 /DNA_ORIENTATION=-